MKTIQKIKESSKAVAGTALLVGATLAGGAAFATAQSSGSSGSGDATLGDYPGMFINDDGTVSSTVVMGQDAKAIDVVAGAQIAGQLGNNAFSSEMVSAGGSASFGWSATNGATLDTRNDQVYFGQTIDKVRQTLTDQQLSALDTVTFEDDAGNTQDVEQYLYVGNQQVQFGTHGESSIDPELYVNNPSSVSTQTNNNPTDSNGYLYKLQANFEDGLTLDKAGDGTTGNQDVLGQEVSLFGKTFTIAQDSFTGDGLILYGSSQDVQISTGESATVTVNGQEHTISVSAVNNDGVVYSVDGQSAEQDSVDSEFTIDGQTVRIDSKINLKDDSGSATFSIGSEEYRLQDNSAIQNGNGEDIEGTMVNMEGTGIGNQLGYNNGDGEITISSISVAVGAADSDNNYVAAGESFQDPIFNDIQFHFGGLNPDASSADSESVGQIEFGTDGDQTATVSFSNGDDNPSIGFAYGEDSQGTDGDSNLNAQKELALADSEGYPIHVKEGAAVQEDGYFMSDAGDFEHMWKVTGIDADSQNPSSGNEATVDLEDQVTGATVEVNLDADGDGNGATANDRYEGTEVIDGQTYHFSLNVGNDGNAATDAVSVTYGNNADFGNPGEYTDVYSSLETETGSEVAFVEEVTVGENAKIVLPSTDGTGRKTVDLSTVGNGNGNAGTLITEVQAGQTVYQVREANNGEVEISLAADQADGDDDGGNEVTEPSALVVQPENDNDEEDAYVVTPQVDAQDNEVDAGDSAIIQYTDGYSTTTLDSNDNVDVGYNMFGTYTRENTDGQGSFTLNIPDGQATAGAAFTGQKGSLSSSGSSAGKVESMQPTGWNSQYVALDSDNSISQAKQNRDLVLVGGPSVNSLVSELVQANKTMAASEYTQGQGMLQLVEDAFTQGNDALVVAGYSGEDTRQAGKFLLNYEQNSNALSGKDKVTINTAQGTVVQ